MAKKKHTKLSKCEQKRRKHKYKSRSGCKFKYGRVVIKISGEAIGGSKKNGNPKFGIDAKILGQIAKDIKKAHDGGVQIAIVVGGGNIWRGATGALEGMDRTQSDYMGMLATVINALGLQGALEKLGCDVRVMSALRLDQVAEPYIRRRAVRHMEKGRIVIFAAGIGSPYFTTDSTVVQRAIEINADVALVAKNGTPGVCTGDPKTDPSAIKLDKVSLDECLQKGYKVMDSTAFAQALAQKLSIVVIGAEKRGDLLRALRKQKGVGTLVHP